MNEALLTTTCASLNVYTPKDVTPTSNLSVAVWQFGGGLSTGNAANFDPSGIVSDHGLVYVTINQRLGPFGFFTLPGLSMIDGQPVSNFGFMDQNMALRWVQQNIASFGGNPARVTFQGQVRGSCKQERTSF